MIRLATGMATVELITTVAGRRVGLLLIDYFTPYS